MSRKAQYKYAENSDKDFLVVTYYIDKVSSPLLDDFSKAWDFFLF